MRGPAASGLALSVLLTLTGLLSTAPARADGSLPEPRQILLPADRPEQVILATNFGLIFSEDSGKTWQFSCERGLSNYAGAYLLGVQTPHRIFATTNAGLIYSDDDSCGWQAAGDTLRDVLVFAFAVDASNSKRAYAIGAPREDLSRGDSIYVSDDAGLSFGKPVFTSPARSALLSVMVAPSQPSRLFATMFSTPANHPSLLHSDDSGEHWEVVADLVESLGENPFELLAIDPLDENTVYVRVLGASSETLATSTDGGLSFVQSVSIAGKLNAFVKLASGTLIIAGTAGTDAVGYRSKDGGQSFEVWPGAPHGHALAERNGKLYIAGDSFSDGYAIAESVDEGTHLEPLTGFKQVQAVKGCVADLCSESCAYYAGIGLWPEAVCGAVSSPKETAKPLGTGGGNTVPAGGASPNAGAKPGAEEPRADTADAGSPSIARADERLGFRASGGGCACCLGYRQRANDWAALVVAGSILVARRKRRARRAPRATDSRTEMRRRASHDNPAPLPAIIKGGSRATRSSGDASAMG